VADPGDVPDMNVLGKYFVKGLVDLANEFNVEVPPNMTGGCRHDVGDVDV